MNICDLDALAASDEYSEIFDPKVSRIRYVNQAPQVGI